MGRKYGTLLLIDDEKDIGEILTDIFTDMFDKVIYCDNAAEALGVVKATTLSAIITDLTMPGMTGDQLVRKIRSTGNMTPIVFLTGHASKDMILSAMRLGVADVFEKPFQAEHLKASLDRVLEIEKRKEKLHQEEALVSENSEKDPEREKKILGLLQVVNETKKKVS